MLETIDLKSKFDKNEYKTLAESLDLRLGELQRALGEAKIPTIIVFEGWNAAGKGTAIGRLVYTLDPRGFTVHKTGGPSDQELFHPPMRRFWLRLPNDGAIGIFDRSWYDMVLRDKVENPGDEDRWVHTYENIRVFERQLADDGALIIKFWLHISKKEQAKRFKELEDDPALAWRVTKEDKRRHKQYPEYLEAVESMLRETSTAYAPWTAVPAHDRRTAHITIAETIINAAECALATRGAIPHGVTLPKKRRSSPLDKVDMTLTVSREDYDDRLPKLQEELRRLEHLIYVKRTPVIIAYEGWDAAGKGGNIRRLTCELDPRGYDVVPIAAPQGEEKTHHYLWRFWRTLPKAGHITIFDRTWYGRVLVERVEGFAKPVEWQRAYREINEFEHELMDYGCVLVKFWLNITKEEQLARFESRQQTPHKLWKITEEDWRNREKWDDYWNAISDMIEHTSTLEAPWTIIEGNCKLNARIRALETVIKAIKRGLKEND